MAELICESPESRVREYISNLYLQWLAARDYMGSGPFDYDPVAFQKWNEACKGVQQRHFTPDAPKDEFGLGYSWSQPAHHSEHERIVNVRAETDFAVIETENAEHFPAFYEYELKHVGNDWRITKVSPFYAPEGEPLFEDSLKNKILAMVHPDAPLPDLSTGISPNCDRLFDDNRTIKLWGQETPLKVVSAGVLHLPSGAIGVHDFGRDFDDFLPLSRSVVPGDYPVELTVVEGYGAAARIIFRPDCQVVRWAPAPTVDGGSHQAEIAYMNLAFVDAGSLMSLKKREKERHYYLSYLEPIRQDITGTHRSMHLRSSPPENPDAICVNARDSTGDASCYWGLAADGNVVSLVADFQFIAEPQLETILVPWSFSQWNTSIDHPLLTRWNVTIFLGGSQIGTGFHVIGENFDSARLLDSTGNVIANSEAGPNIDTHLGSVHLINEVLTDVQNATMEITISTGYKN
ncbi:DUF4241 domain-containing protein [Verrucomicrobium sp. BvORR106]|uniref:DUF4241 domain-containing protein n=1 Tax=Verrucomicrobium sp. BvORR106 TaxID=1403819 RepID=UPI000570185C|nr:DUF4241 domain-containing protein [Verrucomicrobium sp. BvORR106]